MEYIFIILYFILGSVMGSFFYVVATRLSRQESIISPSSHCDYCNHKLKWYELIPVLSYIIQRGRCRKCKKTLSLSYPVIEIITGVLYAVNYHVFGFSYTALISLIFISALIIVIISDIEYMIILDEVLIVSVILIIIVNILDVGLFHTFEKIGYGCISFLTMYVIKLLGDHLFQKESLGGGDIKLLFLFGLVLGYPIAILTIFMATFIAFPIAIYILISNKDSLIPFGPFLCMSAILMNIWGISFSEIINFIIKI